MLIVLAVMALVPASAAAIGFTTEDMARAARAARPDGQIMAARTLFAETETLRAAFVINPARSFAALSTGEREVLRRATEPATERRMLALQWFMRGGVVKASIVDGAKLSGIYHPAAQVWLLIRWDRGAGNWRVTDAQFVPASTLAEGKPGDAPDIATAYRRAMADFARVTEESAIPTIFANRLGDRAIAQTAAFARIDATLATLGPLYGEVAQARAMTALNTAIGAGTADWTSAALVLPSQARATLAPVTATRTADGIRVWLSSPLMPATLLTADWAGGDFGKRPVVRAVPLERLSTAARSEGIRP